MDMVDKDIVQIKNDLDSLTTKLLRAYHDSVTGYTEGKMRNAKDLEEQNNVNSSLISLVEDNEKKIQHLTDIIESKDAVISTLEKDIKTFSDDIVELKKEKSNSERHDMLKAQATEIMAKSDEIDRLNKLLSKRDKKTNVEMVVKEEIEKVDEVKVESVLDTVQTESPVKTESHVSVDDETESLSDKEPSDSEEEELSIIKYRKKEYYIDTSDPPNVYEILEDDEMGDKIGTWQETQGKNGKMKHVVVRD